MNVIQIIISLNLFRADFAICTDSLGQFYARAIFANNQYYVFWEDMRFASTENLFAIYGARVSSTGTVIDPNGKQLFKRIAKYEPAAAYDGINFLVAFRDSC